ncbi:aspartate/glutamate racemase family protein [Chromohalobacter sp. TMW 2.2308]|uniref:Aspartate/glutamate racemase family protein n=1 Tax=Chromohalobacter moromii TaxID=2860329 RepID=A0A9X3B5U8_9GAMM|nr:MULTISPECIES: aspartate/glutamate racemase family protein [Chromohalobacter]MCK2043306.1 aspartate/glutamate racemase family protein [Chromohalobacter moromii]MCK2046033.1 aspartate/glutamate racemase family protein [Chromohalobacter moromii]MCT8505543.1 aspartate/glutamate racemase family protein [Chromohalobacter moromii]MCT8515458.1 aspartate/glutamate racemase family protein [Chromohalobacter sp. TMW 2.2271]
MIPNTLHQPIAVFDAGIGSYAIVAEIQRQLPNQDIIYLADRASFPYGDKSPDALSLIMQKTLRFLEEFNPSAIVVASNAPSITVLEAIRPMTRTPLFGVFPPLKEAISRSQSGKVGIMGVRALVESEMLRNFVSNNSTSVENVALLDASSMVELVESGTFLFDPARTQAKVQAFVEDIFKKAPTLDVLTLSSTHLPWLKPFFERARPQCHFLDPAENIVASLGEGTAGSGIVKTLVSEDERYSVDDFHQMLFQLGVDLPLEVVEVT